MSKKDAYYFSHDSNAKDDFKCMLLIEELGLEGYGIFWVLIETLREQENYKYPLRLLPSLARKYNTTLAKIQVVVSNYNLFLVENEEFFFSESLNRRMALMNKQREQRRLAGIKSGENRRLKNEQKSNGCSTTVQRKINDRSTSVEQPLNNKKKRKESKEKENKDILTLRKLSDLTAKQISEINIDFLDLTCECKSFIEKNTLARTIDYAINNTEYLIKEINI